MSEKKKRIKFEEGHVEPPKPTYFFQFPNQKPFATEEKEAWELYRGKGNWTAQGVQYIGQSNGIKAYEARIEATKIKRPKHECTLLTEGDCYTCEDVAEESREIIRQGFEAELEEAKKNTAPPTNSDVYFMGGMTPEQQAKIKGQIHE